MRAVGHVDAHVVAGAPPARPSGAAGGRTASGTRSGRAGSSVARRVPERVPDEALVVRGDGGIVALVQQQLGAARGKPCGCRSMSWRRPRAAPCRRPCTAARGRRARSPPSRPARRAVEVGLQHDADVVVGRAQPAEDVERALRVLRALHVDAHEAAHLAGRRRAWPPRSRRQNSSEMSRPSMVSLIETLRSISGGICRRSCLVGLRAARGGLAVEHVLAQEVEGGPDAAGVELRGRRRSPSPAVSPGHEPAREDERWRDHRRERRAPRARGGAHGHAPGPRIPPAPRWRCRRAR